MAENDGYVHKKGLVYKNQYHIIFCPKYRRKVLINGIDERLKEILYDIAEDLGISYDTLSNYLCSARAEMLNTIQRDFDILPENIQVLIKKLME